MRVRIAREHIEALTPRLSYVRLRLGTEARPPDFTVRLDGVEMGPATWDKAVPIDPGHHEITVSAEKSEDWHGELDVREETKEYVVDIPALTPKEEVTVEPSTEPPAAQSRGARKVTGIALVSGGAVALGVGATFGLLAMNKRSQSDKECISDNACTSQGIALNRDAITNSWISTAGFGVGLVAAGVGSYLLLTSGSRSPHRTASLRTSVIPEVSAHGGMLTVGRAF